MRNKYSVTFNYPVRQDGEVKYTTSKKFRFKFWLTAKIFRALLKTYCKIKGQYYSVWMFQIAKYSVDTDLGISYADCGPWRSYHLDTCGDSLEEMIKEACISEVDQDGGELDCYGLDNASSEVEKIALELINEEVSK